MIVHTTIELRPEQVDALMALARERGEIGLSGIVEEAIDSYLKECDLRTDKKKTLLSLAGSISEEEAEELKRVTRDLRATWR